MQQGGYTGPLPKGLELDAAGRQKLNALAATREGQRVHALLGDEKKLSDALEKGDTATLKQAMESVMRDPAGRKFLEDLSRLMGKP